MKIEQQSVLAAPALSQGTIKTALHARMRKSALNVRRKRGDNIDELVALIRAHGLLQNLVGYEEADAGGEITVHVIAGGRRLRALGQLIAAGELPEDLAIPYLLISEAEAVSLSLAENSGREAMHPADVFECMQALAAHGASAEDIGLSFGVDALTVKRRLKLAKVSPRLFALYRNDEINLEQMMALALSDDHAAQEQAWDSLDPWSRSQPHHLRRLLTAQKISLARDPVARFVGRGAFARAGGQVESDLFSDSNEGWISDATLLDHLAHIKLEARAARLQKAGARWVDVIVRCDGAVLASYGKVRRRPCAPDDDQQKALDAIDAELSRLNAEEAAGDANDGDEQDALHDERRWQARQTLARSRRALLGQLVQAVPEDAALAGTVLTVSREGKFEQHDDLIRPDDRKKLKPLPTEREKKAKSVHSERLLGMLTAHRTAGLACEVMTRPPIALAVLVHALVEGVFFFRQASTSAVVISLRTPAPIEAAKDSAAMVALAERHAAWFALLRPVFDEGLLLDWLLQQEQALLLDLLSFCVACAIETGTGEAWRASTQTVARAVSLDMGRWWQASAANYFSHVSKERMREVVTAAVGLPAALPLAAMKRQAAAEAAERALTGKHWLPDSLRVAPV